MKTCTKCGETKPLDEFNRDRSRKDGRHPWCRACGSRRRASWYEKNREANLAYQAEWREQNREKKAASDRRWRSANLGRKADSDAAWRRANTERLTTYFREYRQANKDKGRDWKRNRRARRANAYVAIVRFDEILQRDLGVCGICGKPIMDDTIELDHIIPLAAGGTHEPGNAQIAHRTCNRRKAAKVGFTLADAA